MNLEQAFFRESFDRFETMQLAQELSALYHKGFVPTDLKCVDFDGKEFHFPELQKRIKKDGLIYFSHYLEYFQNHFNRRLTSIFMNHYLACQNDVRLYRVLKEASKPLVIACGGFSGSGKSRIAREIAPFLNKSVGALVIRDDIVRKQILCRSLDETLDDSYFTPILEKRVYRRMRFLARQALKMGQVVILDALFYQPFERKTAQKMADLCGVPFVGLWMQASLDERLKRIETRQFNPSDVKTVGTLLTQMQRDVGTVTWQITSTDQSREETMKEVLSFLQKKNIPLFK